jgi:putative oxidoreductase
MGGAIRGVVAALGRLMLSAIFLLSAVGNKIPNFAEVSGDMAANGVPAPNILLVGAILFLIVGSLSLLLGFHARWGAALLLVFLILATYYFHDFWTLEDAAAKQEQMIQFMKNVALMGAMLLILANGPGPFSFDMLRRVRKAIKKET